MQLSEFRTVVLGKLAFLSTQHSRTTHVNWYVPLLARHIVAPPQSRPLQQEPSASSSAGPASASSAAGAAVDKEEDGDADDDDGVDWMGAMSARLVSCCMESKHVRAGAEDLSQVCRVGKGVPKHTKTAHAKAQAARPQQSRAGRGPCGLFDLAFCFRLEVLSSRICPDHNSTVPVLPRGGCVLGSQGLRLSGCNSFDMKSFCSSYAAESQRHHALFWGWYLPRQDSFNDSSAATTYAMYA